MTISKGELKITTLNATIAFVLGLSALLGFFYNTKAELVEANTELTGRVIKLETIVPEVNRRLESIEGSMQTMNSAVLKIVNAQR